MEDQEHEILEVNQEEDKIKQEPNEQDQAKLQKIEASKKELLSRVVSGNIYNIRDRVAFILNNFVDARNSDIDLAWEYWQNFESDKFNGHITSREQLRSLTKINSLTRVRAKIQNEYKLYEADVTVKRFRGVLEEDKKAIAVEDKPSGVGVYSVYIDETGKTQDFLSVGSVWILEGGSSNVLASLDLHKWKKDNNIDYEFHFAQINKTRHYQFKEFFNKFLSLHPAIGFKIIVINNKGLQNKNAAITDLTYHLLIKGVIHEHETRRAPLPRVLQVWLDEEEKGSDSLKIENIKERINSQKIEGLHLGDLQAISSKDNFYIQIIDLFTGAINRKLNSPSGSNVKDEFADFVLNTLKFDISLIDKENKQSDNSTVFNLK